MKGEFKQILLEVFNVLGFSDVEKEKALGSFKRKLAFELLGSLKDKLSTEHREWISNQESGSELDPKDPKVIEIQQTIKDLYSEDELYQKSKEIFKKLLQEYVQFMSSGLEPERISQLKIIFSRI